MDFFLRTIKDPTDPFQVNKPSDYWGQGTNDFLVDTNADFALTEGVDCLNQSMAKILVTERGANLLFPAYGSTLPNLIGLNFNIDYLRGQVKTTVIDTLRIYQFINQVNPNLDEQINTLKSLAVNPVLNNQIDVSFTVITRTGKTTGSIVQVEG